MDIVIEKIYVESSSMRIRIGYLTMIVFISGPKAQVRMPPYVTLDEPHKSWAIIKIRAAWFDAVKSEEWAQRDMKRRKKVEKTNDDSNG